MRHEPQRPDAVGVIVGHHALAMEGVGNLHTGFFGESDQGGGGVAACRTVSGQHHRLLCLAQDIGGPGNLSGGRRICANDSARQRRQLVVGVVFVDVFGDGEVHRGRAFGLRRA